MKINEVEFELICPRELMDEDFIGPCKAEFMVTQEIIPSEIYGADADGNRGERLPAFIELNTDRLPVSCPLGHVFTQHEIKMLETQLQAEIDDYKWDDKDG